VRPLEHTGSSANLAYYRERGARRRESYVWAEVLRAIPMRRAADGSIEIAPGPISFYVTAYRLGVGEIGRRQVTRPRHRAPEILPARTVARVVREILSDA
jgi:hypothetical protein